MWKPGAAAPGSGKKSSKNKQSSDAAPIKNSQSLGTSKKEAKSSTPKKLSGATMNMRFMKRKQETRELENQRKKMMAENNAEDELHAAPTTSLPTASPPSLNPPSARADDDAMQVDQVETNDGLYAFKVATPIDMYGMQASLIGRRSFGGFNPAMEEAWKESKASLEHQTNQSKNKKVSDEELIQRYQDIVKKRSESSRAVGNLKEKTKNKRQRR